MTASKKTKTIDSKIEQKKVQYNLDRQTATISALSSGNVGKYESGEDILLEKKLLEKVVTMKKPECSSLRSELKKEIDIAKRLM